MSSAALFLKPEALPPLWITILPPNSATMWSGSLPCSTRTCTGRPVHNKLTLLSTAEPIEPIQPSRQAMLASLRKCRLGTAVLVVQRHRLQRTRALLVL